ncbi:MAG: hypothetical protein WBQ60_00830 [Asticcacaulis sp.]
MRLMIHLALIGALCLTACGKPPEKQASPPTAARVLPADQTSFIALPHDIRDKIKDPGAATDTFCAKFQDYHAFNGWKGTLKDLRISTLDGTADLEINLGRSIRIEAIIPKSDPLYPALSSLTYGSPMTVSGKFTHANNNADCTYYFGPFGVHLSALKGD